MFSQFWNVYFCSAKLNYEFSVLITPKQKTDNKLYSRRIVEHRRLAQQSSILSNHCSHYNNIYKYEEGKQETLYVFGNTY